MNTADDVQTDEILLSLFGSSAEDDSDDDDQALGVNVKSIGSSEHSTLSAVTEFSDIGGCRGLTALSKIPPGVLILAEIPAVTWSGSNLEEEDDLGRTIEACLNSELAHQTTKILHPQSLKSCDTEEIQRAEDVLGSLRISEIASKSGVTIEEVLRVLLVLQHNGFESGLYGVLTMLNHSCNPNCIKFSPSTGSSSASEIWTVREVEKGEELTICYCEPLETTSESIRQFLEVHHRFFCKCSFCTNEAITENNLTDERRHLLRNANVQAAKLQELIVGMEQEMQFLRNLDDLEVGFESVVKLMRATTDLSSVESDANTTDDIPASPRLLARLCKLAANVAVTFLEYSEKTDERGRRPKGILLKTASFSFLRNSISLLSHQMKYLGPYHPDIASSHIDIAEALECVLKFYPEDLITALCAPLDGFPELKLLKIQIKSGESTAITKQAIVKESIRFRAEGTLIKNLYSRSLFPSRYVSLRGCLPGACHWGDLIPPGHLKNFSTLT